VTILDSGFLFFGHPAVIDITESAHEMLSVQVKAMVVDMVLNVRCSKCFTFTYQNNSREYVRARGPI